MKIFLCTCFAGLLFLGGCAVKPENSIATEASKHGDEDGPESSKHKEREAAANEKVAFFNVSTFGPQVVPFTTEEAAQKKAATQTVVYYFTATWCFECQETYQDLQRGAWKRIPRDLTLVFVDYDKERGLKQKYGVTIQHSFVVIGPAGEKKKIWAGTVPVADIVKIARER